MSSKQPSSSAKIGLFTCIFLVMAVMIGNGIYTSLGIQLLSLSHGFSILVLWGLGGLVALSGALSYAEVAARLPRSGGEYYYLSQIYHPAVGTMAGIIMLLAGFVAPVSLASMAFGKYMHYFFPHMAPMFSSMLLVSVVTGLHLFHLNLSASFQNAITALKFLFIGVMLFLGFRYASQAPALFFPSKASFTELMTPRSGVVLLFCFYAYSGWNSSVYIADEVVSSRRNVGLSLVIGTIAVTLLYLLLNAVFLLAAPIADLRGVVDVGSVVATHLLGSLGARCIVAFIAVGLVAGVSGMIWIGPQMMHVMAENIRAFRWLRRSERMGVPTRALLFQYGLILLVLATSSFKAVLVTTQIPVIFCALLGVMGLLVLRYREKKSGFAPLGSQGFRCPFYPLPSLFFAGVSIVALIYTMMTNPWEGVVGCGLILGAILLYPFLKG